MRPVTVLSPIGVDPTTGVEFERPPGVVIDPTHGGAVGYVPTPEEQLSPGSITSIVEWWYAPETGPVWEPSRTPPTAAHVPATPAQIPSAFPDVKGGVTWLADLVGGTAFALVKPLLPLVVLGLIGVYVLSKKSAVTIRQNPGRRPRGGLE